MSGWTAKEILGLLFMVAVFIIFVYETVTTGEYLDSIAAVTSIVLAIISGVSYSRWLIEDMKNIQHATEAADYLKKASVKVKRKSDKFVAYERWKGNELVETSKDINKGGF